ncbi:MAG TPA: hypothetical protein VG184_04885 [Acidimicrobiales bacterium]|nr:hypothetical protein [Acidimicrobiales bacterium]
MSEGNKGAFTMEELQSEQATELPDRDLLIAISVLGLPLLGVDGIAVNVSGPRFLA